MTTQTRNEAAERLRALDPDGIITYLLGSALAAERRATVERIREAVNRELVDGDFAIGLVHLDTILDNERAGRILDEEAAR